MMNFQLDSVIEVLLSADNKRRIQAEEYINQIPSNHFDAGINAFLLSMAHQNEQVASMAGVLLKKKYLDIKQNLNNLTKEHLERIVETVQNCMVVQRSVMFLKRCCQILVKIYTFANLKPELIHLIQKVSNIQSHNMKMTLMYLIEIICECAFDDTLLMQNAGVLDNIFQKGLQDENNEVKVASFKALTIFLSSITDEKLMKKFSSVLQILLQKAIELIKYDQESGVSALQSLNELIEAHPKFIKPIMGDILVIFTEIMEAPQLLLNLRSMALSGIHTLCLSHHSTIRKSQYFKTKMVPSYMKMMSEMDNTPLQEWAEELIQEVISKSDISMITQEHLGQITELLGNKFMLPLFVPYIQQCLSQKQVNYQHSGLTALAILTENCHQSFKGELKNMVSLILPLLQVQDPKIIYDVLIAMGYMATEFAPEIQTNFGEMILKYILEALRHPYPKVQYKAVNCIVSFEQGLMQHKEITVMHNFLDDILGQLCKIFERSLMKNEYIMLEATLDCIATLAQMNPFAKYYPNFMPGLKKIISMVGTDTQQKMMIKSKTIEAMGDLLSSVKDHEELFKPDCESIMQNLMTLQSQLDKDDNLHKAIFTVYENVVACIHQNFAPYADFVFEKALDSLKKNAEAKIIDEAEVEKPKEGNSLNKYIRLPIDLKMDGVKNIVLNTDLYEQKLEGGILLSEMAENMKGSFLKYADFVLPAVIEFMSYKSNKQLRQNMMEIAKNMVIHAYQIEEKLKVLNIVFMPFCNELSTIIRTKAHEQANSLVEKLAEMMPFMPAEMLIKLPDMMMAVISMVNSLNQEIEKIYSEKEMDEDLEEEMSSEIAQVEEVLEHVETIMKQGKGMASYDNLRSMFPKDYEFTE